MTGMLLMYQDKTFAESIPAPFAKLGALLEMPEAENWQKYSRNFIERWGRSPGQERWELPEFHLSHGKQQQVYETLEELGMISPWLPHHKEYDYGIIPGSTLPGMKLRLDWLANQWQNGVHFKSLVVLTGQRPLTPSIDHFQEVMTSLRPDIDFGSEQAFPMHETEAVRLLFHYYKFPDGMESIPLNIIDCPRKWLGHEWGRCHTKDTVDTWLEQVPKPGSTLVVSSQPSAHYQKTVFRKELPTSFSVDMSAPGTAANTPIAPLLDAVAVWLRAAGNTPPRLLGQ